MIVQGERRSFPCELEKKIFILYVTEEGFKI
jgi:hypothetical protein